MSNSKESDIQKAFSVALTAREQAHAPYSGFCVGAALKVKESETPIGGCNVENASFGGTICAERVAVVRAVAEYGKIHPEFLVVVTGEPQATVPCALCLQVLAEFCDDEMPIHLGNKAGLRGSLKFRDLLPHPFRTFGKDTP